jgi:hypothetical protein
MVKTPHTLYVCAHRANVPTADIFTSGENLEEVVSQFLTNYATDAHGTMQELVNMVIRSSGCNIEITKNDIADVDNVDNKLNDIQDEFLTVCRPRSLIEVMLMSC